MVAERVHGPLWTVEQYLEMERQSPIRHEFIDGYVYAMAGGTQRHVERSGADVCVSGAQRTVAGSDIALHNFDVLRAVAKRDLIG